MASTIPFIEYRGGERQTFSTTKQLPRIYGKSWCWWVREYHFCIFNYPFIFFVLFMNRVLFFSSWIIRSGHFFFFPSLIFSKYFQSYSLFFNFLHYRNFFLLLLSYSYFNSSLLLLFFIFLLMLMLMLMLMQRRFFRAWANFFFEFNRIRGTT